MGRAIAKLFGQIFRVLHINCNTGTRALSDMYVCTHNWASCVHTMHLYLCYNHYLAICT